MRKVVNIDHGIFVYIVKLMCGFKLYLIFIPFTTDTYFYYKQYLSGLSENQTLSKHCTHTHISAVEQWVVLYSVVYHKKKLGFFICIIILYCLNEKRFLLVFLCCVCSNRWSFREEGIQTLYRFHFNSFIFGYFLLDTYCNFRRICRRVFQIIHIDL